MDSTYVAYGLCYLGHRSGQLQRPAPPAGDEPRADPADTVKVTLGGNVYRQHCARCHGTKREGQSEWWRRLPTGRLPAPLHDDSWHTWHHPDYVLFAITKNGLVPPYAPLRNLARRLKPIYSMPPASYRYRESYPRRNGSPRNCCQHAGGGRSAVPVCV